MKIEFDQRHFGKIIRVTADNVRIEEDVEKRTYKQLEGGKLDFNPSRDIEDSAINMFQEVLCGMMYCRVEDYDSSNLIKALFEKLPMDLRFSLSASFSREYSIED